VFGYFGALIARAVIERSLKSIVLAMITITLYGGLIWGVLPLRGYISFEGHFFGLIAGVLYVWIMHKHFTQQ
jgi:membrane associated rhomboid family serine protease